jgi:translocation and assembly module TamB
MLNANLRLAATAQSPQLFGQMQLSGVDIDGNFMPFDMQPSQMAMNFNGMSSTLQGGATQQGQINLSGDADWSQIDNWRARIAAKAARCASPYRRWCAGRVAGCGL